MSSFDEFPSVSTLKVLLLDDDIIANKVYTEKKRIVGRLT